MVTQKGLRLSVCVVESVVTDSGMTHGPGHVQRPLCLLDTSLSVQGVETSVMVVPPHLFPRVSCRLEDHLR